MNVLGNAETDAIQAAAALGLSKLLITGVLMQERVRPASFASLVLFLNLTQVVQSLAMVYFSPETMENQELRQCLSIALPIYACSSSANQQRLQRVGVPRVRSALLAD